MNRAVISGMAFLLVSLSVVVYEERRKGVGIIPLIYVTANLDCIKSADCLERMAELIGIPMFTSLFYREQSHDLYSMVALCPFPLQVVAFGSPNAPCGQQIAVFGGKMHSLNRNCESTHKT